MKPTVAIITHVHDADIDRLLEVIAAQGADHVLVKPFAGDPVPDLDTVAAVVILGGPMGAHETAEHPFLTEEIALISDAAVRGTDVLGICLGSQLAARALGGSTGPGADIEHGVIDVELDEAATDAHPLAKLIAGRHFSFHGDTVAVADDTVVLAVSDRYPQAWTRGSILGVQFHPEISITGVADLVEHERGRLAGFGIDADAMAAEHVAVADDLAEGGRAFLDAWLTAALSSTRERDEAAAP